MGAQLSIVPDENAADDISFGSFWLIYPRKESRKDALKAWSQIDPKIWLDIIISCAAWRLEWARQERQFLPYAATWLRGERWEDELPQQVRVSSASHVPMKRDEPMAKSELPQSVRDLIAKMKR